MPSVRGSAPSPFSFTPQAMFSTLAIACYWGFIFAAYWGTAYLAGGGTGDARTFGELSALIGQCVGFIVIALLHEPLSSRRGLDALVAAAAVLCPIGAIPSIMNLCGAPCPLALLAVCIFLLACGHACLLCRLGFVLESLTGPLMCVSLAIATLLSCGIFVATVALPFAFQVGALLALPWVCCGCMMPSRPGAAVTTEDLKGSLLSACANRQASSDYRWFLLQLFFFSFSFCLVQAAGSDIVGTSTATGLYWISIFLSGSVLLVYGVFINRYISPQTTMWFLLPLAALGFMPLTVLSVNGRLACWVMVTFGFTLFDMLGLFNLSSFIRYNGLSVMRYFPLGRLAGAVALVAGWIVGTLVTPDDTTMLVYISLVLVLVLFCMMCAYIWKLTHALSLRDEERERDAAGGGGGKDAAGNGDAADGGESAARYGDATGGVGEDAVGYGEETDGGGEESAAHARSWASVCEEAGARFALSPREREVFFLLAQGETARNIADRLFISISTTRTHIHRIYQKANIGSQQELVEMMAADYGWHSGDGSR